MEAHNIGADRQSFEAIIAQLDEVITAELDAELDIDTAPIEQAITTEQHPVAPAPSPAPTPEPDNREQAPGPASTPNPEPEPAAPVTAAAGAAVAVLPEIEAPPELVVPPEPVLNTSALVTWWAKAFPHLVWLSVIAGLVGQIYGWTETFGGGLIAVAVAVVLGGTFEFIMVAASSRGLRDIGRNRSPWQAAAFLVAGTACAGMAFWMNLHHFTGTLALAGVAAAAATAIGYLAHVAVHFFDELDNRRELAAWEKKRDRIAAEIAAREAKVRAEHDAYQTELRKARAEELKARTRPAPANTPRAAASRGAIPAQAPRSAATKPTARKNTGPKKATLADARVVFKPGQVEMPKQIADALIAQGFKAPHPNSVQNWSKQLRAEHESK